MHLMELKGWEYEYSVALFRYIALSRRGHRARICFFLLFLLLALDAIFTTSNHLRASLSSSSISPPPSPFPDTALPDSSTVNERIYIASLHFNDELLLRSHWIPSLLSFVTSLPSENVYVSIAESGSSDDTKGALRELDAELEKLGIERSIVLEDRTHADEITAGLKHGAGETEVEGWIQTPRGMKEMRRIPFLAALRNRVMEKLRELASRSQEDGGRRMFDKVLWLNDVVFTSSQIHNLLQTNGNSYAAACALDFSESYTSLPEFYDSFAVRDNLGLPLASQRWPFFQSPLSRTAVFRYAPVPVQSCWNGMVVFAAAPFYSSKAIDGEEDDNLQRREVEKNGMGLQYLKFRAIPDTLAQKTLEASECCLINIDNPLSLQLGVYINPNVRVAYNAEANAIVNPSNSIFDQHKKWPSAWGKFEGVWINRWARWAWWYQRWRYASTIDSKVREWMDEGKEKGVENMEKVRMCLVNEMQLLTSTGWQYGGP